MKVLVIHEKEPSFSGNPKTPLADHYAPVAVVEVKSISDVFALTNSIDDHWIHNQGVLEVFNQRARSTSVGDLLIDDQGTLYVYKSFSIDKLHLALPTDWSHFYHKIAPYVCPSCGAEVLASVSDEGQIDIWTGTMKNSSKDVNLFCSECDWTNDEEEVIQSKIDEAFHKILETVFP